MKRSLKFNKELSEEFQDCYDREVLETDNSNLAESERFVKMLKVQIDVIKKIIDPGNNYPR